MDGFQGLPTQLAELFGSCNLPFAVTDGPMADYSGIEVIGAESWIMLVTRAGTVQFCMFVSCLDANRPRLSCTAQAAKSGS